MTTSEIDPGLYIVATPIGNLADVSRRALAILSGVDRVACEDTRVTARLLNVYGISVPMTAYHEHNAERVRPRILARLREGGRVALVSDAGTPLISDPGWRLVREAVAEGIPVRPVPGASAVMAALTVAGLPTDRFLFQGFLPAKSEARRRVLSELALVPATLVFYETAPRLAASLAQMAEVLGSREAAVARELTKLHEEVLRGPLDALAARIAERPVKGEIVVVVAPPAGQDAEPDPDDVDALLRAALERASVKEAVAEVASVTGMPRRRVYARALELTGRRP